MKEYHFAFTKLCISQESVFGIVLSRRCEMVMVIAIHRNGGAFENGYVYVQSGNKVSVH